MTAVGLLAASGPPSVPIFPANSDAQDLEGSGSGASSFTWTEGSTDEVSTGAAVSTTTGTFGVFFEEIWSDLIVLWETGAEVGVTPGTG